MSKKSTQELKNILSSTHVDQISDYLTDQEEEMLRKERPFAAYMRSKIAEKKLRQQDIFLWADISEKYGYKLISEEKHTRQRDVILRICYAAHFTLEETQKALKIYGMPELYARIPRDAILMIAFNDRPGSVIDVNKLLSDYHEQGLKPCGSQE